MQVTLEHVRTLNPQLIGERGAFCTLLLLCVTHSPTFAYVEAHLLARFALHFA